MDLGQHRKNDELAERRQFYSHVLNFANSPINNNVAEHKSFHPDDGAQRFFSRCIAVQ